MAPSLKGKRKKKFILMDACESQKALEEEVAAAAAAASPRVEESQSSPEKLDQVEAVATKVGDISKVEQKSLTEESGDEQLPNDEREEEQTFLVNLYKFMKERHTPIERVPHLGFKQINLYKIYKVVEKLGAYELVTGRRLWKNVYDMLGGSPGSTSAATCTRRHYERLVLPYVRHLKGEDDKPLPPVKPRKQYKVSKEPKGDKGNSSVEKKRPKKEKIRDQVLPEKLKADVISDPKHANEVKQNQPAEQTKEFLPLTNGRETSDNQPPEGCHCNCRASCCSEAYQRLFSSFYFKGNHGIMSPLAKKKLLAQVSKAESLYGHEKHLSHCPEYKKARSREVLDSEPEASPKNSLISHNQKETHSPVLEVDGATRPACSPHASKTNEGTSKASLSLKDSQVSQKAEDANSGVHPSPGPPVFTGYFHTYQSDVLKPISCHPFRGPVEFYHGFKDFTESFSSYHQPGKDLSSSNASQKGQEDMEDQPEDLSRRPSQPSPTWRGDIHQHLAFQMSSPSGKKGSSPFLNVKASWVPPVVNLTKVSPQASKDGGQPVSPSPAQKNKRTLEEESFLHGKKLKVVSPFVKEVESNNGLEHGTFQSGQQGVAKLKADVSRSVFPAAPTPQLQDMYKGTMLRVPMNFSSTGDHLKGQAPSLIPSLSVSPFIIPAFPTPLLTASVQPSDFCQPLNTSLIHYPTSYDGTLRHRLYPVSTWHSQPTYASPHVSSYHRNTKL
ncbi:AT-rich interactive domain-containing protein 5A isoform X2 [Sphaerodactylus townsendi]|uniref:AT-rich interactive domain-containing protein 5A isoform X2 n=1 Tax=Sphaerodactylus townsendi TaxID=933632 RepID=UPI002025C5F5|nr:AT-rich interactive domain-containing protein 5A isoform X2 [Sphaerodactylus townsendi]